MTRTIVLAAVVAAVLAVSGCGGAQAQPPNPKAPAAAATPPPQPAVAPVEQTVKLTDYAFEPKELVIPLGAEVKLTVTNEGRRPHNWTVNEYGIKTRALESGEQQVLTFKADKAGRFEVACTQKGHKEKGMLGTLAVG